MIQAPVIWYTYLQHSQNYLSVHRLIVASLIASLVLSEVSDISKNILYLKKTSATSGYICPVRNCSYLTGKNNDNVWVFGDKVNFTVRSPLLSLPNSLGPDSIKRCHLTSIGNPIVEIRRSHDRLISTMGFPILVRRHLYIESGP